MDTVISLSLSLSLCCSCKKVEQLVPRMGMHAHIEMHSWKVTKKSSTAPDMSGTGMLTEQLVPLQDRTDNDSYYSLDKGTARTC